jgi:exopolysaccharide biosynthesis WecB/TagA/CpsF family protein
MISHGKHNLLGVMIDGVDYEEAVRQIADAASHRQPFGVTALAVHGVMTGYRDPDQRHRLNALALVVPDGQPVRWALNALHGTRLTDRVYGPTLMLEVCRMAARERLGIYLYGSTEPVLARLTAQLRHDFPGLCIVGAEPSRFRRLTTDEKHEVIERIRGSGAQITFVGLGCPRQEAWAYEYQDALAMPLLAVGAAFDFHAGTTRQAPAWMQRRGLEWLFRLGTEPHRLWRRYLILNPWYVALVLAQYAGLRTFDERDEHATIVECSYG